MGTFEQALKDPTLGLPEPLGEGDLDCLFGMDDLAATAGHIELLNRKINALQAARVASWNQLLTAAARMYRSGVLDDRGALDLYHVMARSYGTGYTRVWDRNMPVPSCRVSSWPRQWAARELSERLNQPNGPEGSWVGPLPLEPGAVCPGKGISVVYVLYDADHIPIYVGSSQNLRGRLSSHAREKPDAVTWTAYRCRDREHAYEVEVRLLNEHKPRLNKKVTR